MSTSDVNLGQTQKRTPLQDSFAVSRLYNLRRDVQKRPFAFLRYFVPITLLWTLMMSYGSSIYGSNKFAVQYMPFIAHYSIILGIMIYPISLAWLPTIIFAILFFVPFALPFVEPLDWLFFVAENPAAMITFFVGNTITGVLIGVICSNWLANRKNHPKPYVIDVKAAFLAEVVFLIVNLVMLLVLTGYMSVLDERAQMLMGYDADYFELGLKRILRGCTVLLVFYLAILQRPERSHLKYAPIVVFIYATLGSLTAFDIFVIEPIEITILSLVAAFLIPTSVAALSLAAGVASYSALTGTFLTDAVPATSMDNRIEYYVIILLNIGGSILAYRTFVAHQAVTNQRSIQKLDLALGYANVGVFVVNQTNGKVVIDPTAVRILGFDENKMGIFDAFKKFDEPSQQKLGELGVVKDGTTSALDLTVIKSDGETGRVRVYIWAEKSDSGASLAYGLVVDITESETQATTLRETLDDLNKKDEDQRRMFSIISHEIRTPASVISMLIEDLEPSNTIETRTKLKEASHLLLGSLSDMRQAVNPEEDLPVIKEPYIPSEVAETIRNTYQQQAYEHRIRIQLKLGDGAAIPRITDTTRVKQIVGNLLRNAIIHSNGSRVEVKFESKRVKGEQWSFWTISDDGKGIPPEEVDRLFEPFQRGKVDPRNQPDGSGLGLYIVRMHAERLGGTIEYIPKDRGATYLVSLPEEVSDVAPRKRRKPRLDLDSKHFDMDVLLVEDNKLVGEVTKARLEKMFRKVTWVLNGADAFAVVNHEEPGILITDLFMPKIEGDELIKGLRQLGHTFPMVGLSAAAVGNDMDRFTAVGADLVMSKPLDLAVLVRSIEAWENEKNEG